MEQNDPTRSPLRISAALAAAQAQPALATPVRFPGEDGGRSLAEMAQRDLDAALQLLADRAQYITGASGAAIALRRDGRNDMLCRASTGTNAPELGALLSTEFGLSGESVRTRRPLRCDDAERDARVNREVCKQLGIASVVVMPVVNDDQVLGVFELFSGKANAFGERDLSAVQRLSEMVETAVRMAHATETLPEQLLARESSVAEAVHAEVFEGQFLSDLVVEEPVVGELGVHANKQAAQAAAEVAAARPVVPSIATAEQTAASATEPEVAPKPSPAEPAIPKKPLFWSAAVNPEADAGEPEAPDQSHVPPVLRGLHKCVACGFPVSAGRVLCVECEEKKWRGQLRVPAGGSARKPVATASALSSTRPTGFAAAAPAPSLAPSPAQANPFMPAPAAAAAAAKPAVVGRPAVPMPAKPDAPAKVESQMASPDTSGMTATRGTDMGSPDFVLSAGLEPSQSWLSRNKYILAALLVVGGGAAAFFLLR
ncbi:MAG TPA: GAF domain-containing protein [Candidatus Dormibacteraeota bacterium]|nr:GAF domain-containing protein [Candidatus Dormibacteraeota bacterium]